jgi:hypothetical protein
MRLTDPSQIKVGMEVFYATCIGDRGSVQKVVISGEVYQPAPSYLGLFCTIDAPNRLYSDMMSLRDCNVVPNGYNKHRLYTKRTEAESYLDYMKRRKLTPDFNRGWY